MISNRWVWIHMPCCGGVFVDLIHGSWCRCGRRSGSWIYFWDSRDNHCVVSNHEEESFQRYGIMKPTLFGRDYAPCRNLQQRHRAECNKVCLCVILYSFMYYCQWDFSLPENDTLFSWIHPKTIACNSTDRPQLVNKALSPVTLAFEPLKSVWLKRPHDFVAWDMELQCIYRYDGSRQHV